MTTTIRNNRAPQILNAIGRASNRALTRAGTAARTYVVKAVAAEVGVTQTVVRKRILVQRPAPAEMVVWLKGKRLRLIDVAAKQRVLPPGAFRATVGLGRHKGVFIRKSPSLSRKGRGLPRSSPQLRIRELYAVSVPYAAIKNMMLDPTLNVAVAAYEKNLAHEVGRALSGAN